MEEFNDQWCLSYDFWDILEYLEIPFPLAMEYYNHMGKIFRKHGLKYPKTIIVIMALDEVMGLYNEKARDFVFLSQDIFDVDPDNRLYYLTHECVHYIDYGLNKKINLTEIQTDLVALDYLKEIGIE